MTNSMTGYAREDRETDFGPVQLELRSVNHRYLETNIRAPEELRPFESAIRESLAQQLSRGKVDCNIKLQRKAAPNDSIEVDAKQLAALKSALIQIDAGAENLNQVSALELLRWPGVIREQKLDVSPLAAEIQSMLSVAIEQLKLTRKQEGERMAALIDERLKGISAIVASFRD